MQIVATIPELQTALAEHRRLERRVGLVPTMGALHAGHLSLVDASHRECDVTVATIFVNPAQFGPTEDFSRYPRTLEHDKELLSEAGCDLLYLPATEDLYPTGFATWVVPEPAGSDDLLCGVHRPGHFRGVLTIVAKLFNLVQPERAYFGQKDFQQAWLIQRMVADLNFPLKVRVLPTVREADGLALSSRNRYLSASERTAALVLSRALEAGAEAVTSGATDPTAVLAVIRGIALAEPAFGLEYAELRQADTLAPATDPLTGELLLALAGTIGTTRLIDNLLVTVPARTAETRIPEGAAHVS